VQNSQCNLIFRAAFPLLVLSLSSCASLGNFLWSGHWEDPNAQEAKPSPPSNEEPAPDEVQKATPSVPTAKHIEESKSQVLPSDIVLTHGSWFLLRTSRAVYSWTGTGEQFRLFAIELQADATCWGSQQADRPEAEHCPGSDGPASASIRIVNGKKVESLFSGFEKAPWKTAQAGTALKEGTYDLIESSGKENGSFVLECKADQITIRTSRALEGQVFTMPSGSNAFLVGGERPDLFDGCTNAKGIVPISDVLGIRFGKKKCGVFRRETEYSTQLLVEKADLEFSTTSKAPDIAVARVKAAELRKIAAANKAQLTLDISGDATHTIFTAMAKRPNGEELSSVEGVRTIDGIHHKCEGKIDRMDAAWVRTAKEVCGAMVPMK